MTYALGLICSPRKTGNCEIMAKEIARHLPGSPPLRLLRLHDFDIRPCIGCYQCLAKKRCVLDDDVRLIFEQMAGADALMVVAPAYFLGANGTLKLLLDRFLSFYPFVEDLAAKPAIGVGVAGIEGREGRTLLDIQAFLKMTLSDVKACRIVYGALPGEIFMDASNKTAARELAAALSGPAPGPAASRCPVCGGDTFRFLGGDAVRCMLCSNTGQVRWDAGRPAFVVEPGEHEMFLSRQTALDHRDWLMGMKNRFLELKSELKAISLEYRDGADWVKPDRKDGEP